MSDSKPPSAGAMWTVSGRIDLKERGTAKDDGHGPIYPHSNSLLSIDPPDLEFEMRFGREDESSDKLMFGASAYHQEDEASSLVYHIDVECHLSRRQAEQLFDALAFALKWMPA